MNGEAPQTGQSNQPQPPTKPGDTISPGGQTPPQAPLPARPVAPSVPISPATSRQPSNTQSSIQEHDGSVSWTASEFIAHHKSPGWYFSVMLAAILVAGLVWLITKDVISASVVVIGTAAFAAYGARKPRQLQFSMDHFGVTVGTRHYQYEMFKSFSIIDEGAFSSIVLMPLKRFAPTTAMYYHPEDEDKILSILTEHLPLEERNHDMIDQFMSKIRF